VLGYEELYSKWKYIDNPKDPEFRKYSEHMKDLALDSNAAALDLAYNVLLVFIQNSDLAVK
jgi:hypothetical protein